EPPHELATERGAEGFDQTIIAGAEHSARQLAQAREQSGHGRMRAASPQKDVGGVFAPKLEETRDIFDTPAPKAAVVEAPAAPAVHEAPTKPMSFEGFRQAQKRFHDGEMTAEEARQTFEHLIVSAEGLKAELRAMPKPDL